MYYKISNILDSTGRCDYKGLDTDKFVSGSHVYTTDYKICLVNSTEEVTPTNTDVTVLTKAEYLEEKQNIIVSFPPKPLTAEEKIADLEQQNAQMLLALVNGGLI